MLNFTRINSIDTTKWTSEMVNVYTRTLLVTNLYFFSMCDHV